MNKKLLVHLHLFYHNQLDYFLSKLKNIQGCNWDLFITVCEQNDLSTKKIKALKSDAQIIPVENRGYDVWPFVQILKMVNLDDYSYVLKIHTKQCMKDVVKLSNLNFSKFQWRDSLVQSLIGTKKIFKKNWTLLNSNPKIGMIADKNLFIPLLNWPEDTTLLEQLKQKLEVKSSYSNFIAGTMFIMKSSILKTIKESDIQKNDFPLYSKSYSIATLAHVMERIFSILTVDKGYQIHLSKGLNLTNKIFNKQKNIINEKTTIKYKLFGLTLLKKTKTPIKKKIKLLGITIYRKKILNLRKI